MNTTNKTIIIITTSTKFKVPPSDSLDRFSIFDFQFMRKPMFSETQVSSVVSPPEDETPNRPSTTAKRKRYSITTATNKIPITTSKPSYDKPKSPPKFNNAKTDAIINTNQKI